MKKKRTLRATGRLVGSGCQHDSINPFNAGSVASGIIGLSCFSVIAFLKGASSV